MHDIFAEKLQQMNGETFNKGMVLSLIHQVHDAIPTSVYEKFAFLNAKTILPNIEIIRLNGSKYKSTLYSLMIINRALLGYYLSIQEYNKSLQLVEWFEKNKNSLKTWVMNSDKKEKFLAYLGSIGGFYRLSSFEYKKAIQYGEEALNMYQGMYGEKNINLKIRTIYQLAQAETASGNLEKSAQRIKELKTLIKQKNVDKSLESFIYLAQANLFHLQGKNEEALKEVNKDIKDSLKLGLSPEALIMNSTYITKCNILNSLKKYKELEELLALLSKMHKDRPAEHGAWGFINSMKASVLYAKGDFAAAEQLAVKTRDMLLTNPSRNPNTVYNSSDPDLQRCYEILGNIWLKDGKFKEAAEAFKLYYVIYKNTFSSNMEKPYTEKGTNINPNINQVMCLSDTLLKGAQASCRSQNQQQYDEFKFAQEKYFGTKNNKNYQEIIDYCKPYVKNIK